MDGNNLQLRLDRCGAFAVPLMAAAKVRRIWPWRGRNLQMNLSRRYARRVLAWLY